MVDKCSLHAVNDFNFQPEKKYFLYFSCAVLWGIVNRVQLSIVTRTGNQCTSFPSSSSTGIYYSMKTYLNVIKTNFPVGF